MIIGNKTDLRYEVNHELVIKFASENEFIYFEASAKKGKGVQEAYDALVRKIVKENFKLGC